MQLRRLNTLIWYFPFSHCPRGANLLSACLMQSTISAMTLFNLALSFLFGSLFFIRLFTFFYYASRYTSVVALNSRDEIILSASLHRYSWRHGFCDAKHMANFTQKTNLYLKTAIVCQTFGLKEFILPFSAGKYNCLQCCFFESYVFTQLVVIPIF